MKKRGFDVYSVPEAVTIALANGPNIDSTNHLQSLEEFQDIIFEFQLSLEGTFHHLALIQHERPAILLYDRGIFDIKPYSGDKIWQEILQRYHTDEASLRERYDLVCHLVSAANGLESHSIQTSCIRVENVSTAKALDEQTQLAWKEHPNHHIVHNDYDTFDMKLEVLLNIVEGFALKRLNK
jgi:hypothetical protein